MNNRKNGQPPSSYTLHGFVPLVLCLIFLICCITISQAQSLRWVVAIPDTSSSSNGVSLTELSNGNIAIAGWSYNLLYGKLVILRSDGSLILNQPYPDRNYTRKDSILWHSTMAPVNIQEQAPGVVRCVAITGFETDVLFFGGSFYIFTMDTLGHVEWENDDFRRGPTITDKPWVYLQLTATVCRAVDNGYITAVGMSSGNGRDIEYTILDSAARLKSSFTFPALPKYYLQVSSVHCTSDHGCLITAEYLADDTTNQHGGYRFPIGVPYLLRLDRNGVKLWDKLILRDTARRAQNGFETPDRGVIVQGRYYTIDTVKKLYYGQGTLTKYGSDTVLRWERAFTVTGRTETFPMAFKPTSDSGFVVCGYSGTINQVTGKLIKSTVDAFLIKFDRNGNKLWEYELPDSLYPTAAANTENVPFDIIETQNGEYVLTGYTGGKAFAARIAGPRSGGVPNSDGIDGISKGSITVSPNPATSEVEIRYRCTVRSDVRVTIVNGLGQQVLTRDCGQQEPGVRTLRMSARDLRTGGYFVKVETASGQSATGWFVVVR